MRRVKWAGETAVYHCMSRTVAGERWLGVREKEALRKMLWQVAEFSGVEVLAYCILSNHFHVLVRVPVVDGLSRAELIRRYEALYGESRSPYQPSTDVMRDLLVREADPRSAEWVDRLTARMGDVSSFMKTLKQRFTMWFNHTHGRFGTLWAERFKSVLIEDDPEILRVVAAYIDLNPVRAGLASDPADYRWCSYAEAMGGELKAQGGLAAAVGERRWLDALPGYRLILFGKGAQGRAGEEGAIPWETAAAVLEKGGKVPLATLLRCRVRYISEGVALGSPSFVQSLQAKVAQGSSGQQTKPRPLPREVKTDEVTLAAFRRLRREKQRGVVNPPDTAA